MLYHARQTHGNDLDESRNAQVGAIEDDVVVENERLRSRTTTSSTQEQETQTQQHPSTQRSRDDGEDLDDNVIVHFVYHFFFFP